MIYLIAGLISSAIVSLVLKICSRWEYDRYGMFAINYLSCLIPFIFSQIGKELPALADDFSFCFIFAILNGLLYLAGLLMNQINVKRNGAILQSTFARLGVMVPTVISIVFFGERPSILETIGIMMVLVSFCIMNIGKNNNNEKPVFSLLILGMLFGGIADSALKVFEQFGDPALENWFMGLTFLSASLICLAITITKKGKIGKGKEFRKRPIPLFPEELLKTALVPDKNIAGIEVTLLGYPLSVTYDINLLGRNQNLKHVLTQVGILDFGIKNLFDLGLFSANGTQHVPLFFHLRHSALI